MCAPLNSLPDWFPLAVIGALLLLVGAIAPPLEILMGIAR